MEEPLMINDVPEAQLPEPLPQHSEKPAESHKLDTPQGCLNDIGEIFKDSAPVKINSPEKAVDVKSKTLPVLQKKTLVRCLDSNGKIVFVELQVDPNNPKNIKIIKTPTVIAATQSAPVSLAKPTIFTQLKLGTQQVRHVVPTTTKILSTSNSPMQSIKVIPAITPRPIIVKGNSNLTYVKPGDPKLENKKIFIIKPSSTLPNLNSTNPPPLVRISNPTKIVLAPSTSSLKVIQPMANDARKVTINANSVLMKNGKVMIVDKVNAKPKQESLLKPQFSLLKPLQQKQISEATTGKSILITKPSPQILGSRYRKQMPLNPAKRDYYKEFRTIFLRHQFETVRSAIEYVLKNTPLINSLSSKTEYNAAFPFVAESHDKFNSYPFAKKRLNEVSSSMFKISFEFLLNNLLLLSTPSVVPGQIHSTLNSTASRSERSIAMDD